MCFFGLRIAQIEKLKKKIFLVKIFFFRFFRFFFRIFWFRNMWFGHFGPKKPDFWLFDRKTLILSDLTYFYLSILKISPKSEVRIFFIYFFNFGTYFLTFLGQKSPIFEFSTKNHLYHLICSIFVCLFWKFQRNP